MTEPRRLTSFVAGVFRLPADGAWVDDVNPSDASDVIARVPAGDPADVDAAADAASAALPSWRARTGPQRADALWAWGEAIAARREELAQAMAREVGKPIGEARGEAARCVAILRYFAGEAVREIGEVIPAQAAGALQFTLREPLGVVALVTPWNFPAAIPLWKAAPALAFGNVVVLKPAEAASGCAAMLAETAAAAGIPPGVFNVVLGSGGVIGPRLVEHERIRAVSFTGSGKVGAQIAASASRRNIRYQTEMGGKNVVIVAPDADLDLAATLTVAGAMRYAGQKCTATSRAVVDRRVRDAFLAKVRAQVDALVLGPVTDPAAAVGPVISRESKASIDRALAGASAERIHGGKLPPGDAWSRGFFCSPAVVENADPESSIARDELFGPVLATFEASDLDEAIALANRTEYGLSASLFTRDIRSALA
ncbi:MAG TPA: aldehyde dehydrogenase family protein, partial [Thermoanaerobaculia bacterium]|nr:aldehyde dehydrogenase family protein [Thermoanaerobaculia bacterium]